ncbi:unnamed protein product [Toxocara canis]|uniref:BPTI/Kunitz inhibitor domain-containing protein n=1 Tax=Toxocara canis TaxID=6265 RepID=A0A183V5L0_TOXCA|nr:unnamed protein product [Toxocara canis]
MSRLLLTLTGEKSGPKVLKIFKAGCQLPKQMLRCGPFGTDLKWAKPLLLCEIVRRFVRNDGRMDGGKGDIRLSQIASQLVMLYIALLSLLFGSPCSADLPEELDAFLEVLFDKSECEEFLSDSGWVSVATHTCAPYECDFPRQLCMRPSGKFKDESSNECRNIPEAVSLCLTAANEGVPLGTSAPKQVSLETPSPLPTVLTITPPSLITATTELKGGSIEQKKPWGLPTVTSICDMGEPQGRFCGFQAKIAYNRETGRCEQFWFPGCTTADTNANLFDTEEECIEATRSCAGSHFYSSQFTFANDTTARKCRFLEKFRR